MRVDARLDGGWMEGQMERVCGWRDRWVEGQMEEWVDLYEDEGVTGSMDGGIDG